MVLLQGCAITGVVSAPESVRDWTCTPIDPLDNELPGNPCFRAVLSAENEITLQWRVTNSLPQVYIYDDFGPIDDVGFRNASCPTEPLATCSAKLQVKTGGFGRWILRADHAGGTQLYSAASITVPSPAPPIEVFGGGFVDVLSPTDRTISWLVDRPCDNNEQHAWIESGGSLLAELTDRYPRCGQEARFIIPAAKLSEPGYHKFYLRDCHLAAGSESEFCSPSVSVGFSVGSDQFLVPNPVYTSSGKDLTITFTSQSGDLRRLYSSTLIPNDGGQAFVETGGSSITIDADLLTPGAHSITLMSCFRETDKCSDRTPLHILVDSAVEWDQEREYTADFLPGVSHAILGPGKALDIAHDSSGGIWLINEFSNAIEHVSPAGEVSSITVPLARNVQTGSSAFKTTKPFAIDLGTEKVHPSYFSMLGERVALVDTTIWFTQGGGMLGTVDINNHSRIISFDPLLSDSPTTRYDDRLCMYNVPTDDDARFGNNQVIGLTAAAGRIWIGESRSLFDTEPSAISSFVPDPGSCENLLNFGDTEALAKQSLQYCAHGQTPEQDRCMAKILLDEFPPGLKVAHLETDAVDDSIWFTDARGVYLGHFATSGSEKIEIYPLPDAHQDLIGGIPTFGGFPWSLRVDEEAVYFAEYSTRHILRFDKSTRTFDEIWIPVATAQVTLHSIDIDRTKKRLWFTLANEVQATFDKTASTIGFIDLASWSEHLANPGSGKRVSGVIYRGLDSIATSSDYTGKHQCFRGIAVDPKTGKIALADMHRDQIVELTPNANSWP